MSSEKKERLELAMFKLAWEHGFVECLRELRDLAIISASRTGATPKMIVLKNHMVTFMEAYPNEQAKEDSKSPNPGKQEGTA